MNTPGPKIKKDRYRWFRDPTANKGMTGKDGETIKTPLENIKEPDYNEDDVLLSWYDSDLNLVINESNFKTATPLHGKGFCYLQAGARASYGYYEGKVCYEVKVLKRCEFEWKEGHLNTHLLRIGWSPRKATLALGSDKKSYGYDSTGRASTLGEIVDYGRSFSTGDVIGAFLDINDKTVSISYTKNGDDLGVAYEMPQTEFQKEPLFPHVLTKNISYECNFGGAQPWYPPKAGYTFAADVPRNKRIPGPRRPASDSECELIMMCGLPHSGKTVWVNEFREAHPGMYYVVETTPLIDRMEISDPERKAITLQNCKVSSKILDLARTRRRNYILDQANLVQVEQVRKLNMFTNYKRRIVVVVIPDEELERNIRKINESGDASWLLQLKAKFKVPTMKCPQISAVADEVEFVCLPQKQALSLVKTYNREAWWHGFKPFKKFVIPAHAFARKKIRQTTRMLQMRADAVHHPDFPSSGDGNSPPRDSDDWQQQPTDSGAEEWQPPFKGGKNEKRRSPPRKRVSEGWQSPSGGRGAKQWQPPDRSKPGTGSRFPRSGMASERYPGVRRREHSASPPRKRIDERWDSQGGQSPPRSRLAEWQSRGGRIPDNRNSPPRRGPDVGPRFPDQHSPPRNRPGEHFVNRERGGIQTRDGSGGRYRDEGVRPLRGDGPGGNWPPQESRRTDVPPHEGTFGGERGDSSPHRRRMDQDVPSECRVGEVFLPGNGRKGGSFSSPSRRMERNMPPRERRFGGDMSFREEGSGDVLHPGERRMEQDFPPQEQRMGGGFPPQESRRAAGFPPQDVRMGRGLPPTEGRAVGPMPPLEGRIGGRMGNDQGGRMIGGVPHDRRFGGNMPPQDTRPARSLSPNERKHIGGPHLEGRIREDIPPNRTRIGDFPPHGGRIGENFPHGGGDIGRDNPPRGGRVGGNFFPPENRMDDFPQQGGRIDDLPSREHNRMSGNLPHNENRMGGNFPPHEGLEGSVPPRGGRVAGDLPSHEGRMSGGLPPPYGGRMGGGDYPPGERMIGDLPPRGGRMGDLPHDERLGGNPPPHGGRFSDDMPPPGARIGGDLPRDIGRGDFPPQGERICNYPSGERIGDNPHGGRIGSDAPPLAERIRDMPPHGGRMSGALPPHQVRNPGDPQLEGRTGSSGQWNSSHGDDQHHPFRPHQGDSYEKGGPGSDFHFQGCRESGNNHPGNGRLPPEGRGDDWKGRMTGANWKPVGGHPSDRESRTDGPMEGPGQQFQHAMGSREHGSERHFHDKRGSPSRPGSWGPLGRRQRPGGPSPSRSGHRSPSPGRNRDKPSPVERSIGRPGRPLSPGRPMGGRQSPIGRPRGRSPMGRPVEGRPMGRFDSGHRSPIPGDGGWQPPGGRQGGGWPDRRNPDGRGARMPPDIGRGHHSPPRKQARMDTGRLVGPSVLFPDGEDEANNPRGPGPDWRPPQRGNIDKPRGQDDSNWRPPQRGNIDKPHGQDDRDRDMGDRMLPGIVSRDAALGGSQFDPHGRDVMDRLNPGHWKPVEGPPREGWQSPAGSGCSRGSRWDRVPEEDKEELAPYEQPFNQAVWDSNEPQAGVFQSGNDGHHQRNNPHRMEDRNMGPGGSRHFESGPHPDNKTRGSVWQRVGGYVDDERERGSRGPPGSRPFGNHGPPGGRGERGHQRDSKERGRDFEERNRRHEFEMAGERRGERHFSPRREEGMFPRDGPPGRWRSPGRKRGGHC